MVFSLFRRKSSPRRLVDADPAEGDVVARDRVTATATAAVGEGLSDRELGRLTAEKIDQIESEMISDALAAGVDELEAQAMGLSSGVDRVRKPSAVELLGEIARKEHLRENGLPEPAPVAPARPLDEPLPFESSATAKAAADDESPTTVVAEPDSLAQTSTLFGEDPFAIEIVDSAQAMPVALEEAAILFSNGNFQGAHEAMRRSMAEDGLTGPYRMLSWHMVFDLLRVIGDREAFDSVAIAYANEAESSPPAWSEDLRAPAKTRSRTGSPSHLVMRGTIDESATRVVEQLQRAANHKRDCSIDLGEAADVDVAGAEQLLRLVQVFIGLQWPLRVHGVARLLDLALSKVETGRPDEDDIFWRLALMCQRLMGDEARFDDLSIDYCVTYEISPPSWEPLPESIGAALAGGDASRDPAPAAEADSPVQMAVDTAHPNRLKLCGELIGRLDPVVSAVNELTEHHEVVVLDCLLLRRVDFAGAGALLNLLIQLQGRNRKVVFLQPNYMVYALMLVMGMQEIASIRRRRV
ncbi:MAG: STAS domain-containing protein [Burkholderiaceae bacterium]